MPSRRTRRLPELAGFLTVAVLAMASLVVAIASRMGLEHVAEYVLRFEIPLVVVPLLYAGIFQAMDANGPAIRRDYALWLVTHGSANGLAWLASLTFMYLYGLDRIGRGIFLIFGGIVLAASLVWRLGLDRAALRLTQRRALIVGGDETVCELIGAFRANQQCRLLPVALVWASDRKPEFTLEGCPIYGDVAALHQVAEDQRADCIVLVSPYPHTEELLKQLVHCQLDGLEVLDGGDVHEALTWRVSLARVTDYWALFVSLGRVRAANRAAKRVVDVMGASILLLVAGPAMALVALAIRLTSPGPILYRQERLGQYGVSFRMIKFRTMVPDAEAQSGPIMSHRGDPRITPVGAVLRRTRLDELPQLFNILCGDMSLVGPRPERDVFVSEFSTRVPLVRAGRRRTDLAGTTVMSGWREAIDLYSLRLLVRPGLTGWAQVNYPYASTLEETRDQFEYDLYYIKNQSWFFDLSILLRTVGVVLWPRGR
jgi:lipopolysaccharide/colanic/teichoic acid biosynthesis glycosyltransferase